MKKTLTMVVALSVAGTCFGERTWTQERLEKQALFQATRIDDGIFDAENIVDIPTWRLDALAENRDFIEKGGWTTNQLIDAFIAAVSNRVSDLSSGQNRAIATIAFYSLSKINHPRARSYLLMMCTNSVADIVHAGVTGVFRYSQYEPEVFDYLRKLCVMTNRYEGVVRDVALDLEDCLGGVLEGNRCAATNQLARYHYFVIRHATARVGLVDHLLSNLLPSYSNSIQRLNAMRHVANTATNRDQAVWATNQVNRLSALPTNQLNNVSWLEE